MPFFLFALINVNFDFINNCIYTYVCKNSLSIPEMCYHTHIWNRSIKSKSILIFSRLFFLVAVTTRWYIFFLSPWRIFSLPFYPAKHPRVFFSAHAPSRQHDVIYQMYKVRGIDALSELYENPFSCEFVRSCEKGMAFN